MFSLNQVLSLSWISNLFFLCYCMCRSMTNLHYFIVIIVLLLVSYTTFNFLKCWHVTSVLWNNWHLHGSGSKNMILTSIYCRTKLLRKNTKNGVRSFTRLLRQWRSKMSFYEILKRVLHLTCSNSTA